MDLTIDGIGGPTFAASPEATAKFGMIASVGQAGGPVGPGVLGVLEPGRSLALACPGGMAHLSDPAVYAAAAGEVLAALLALPASATGPRFALAEAAAAQQALKTGVSTGAPLLLI